MPSTTEYAVRARAEYWGLKVRAVHASEQKSHSQVWSKSSARTHLVNRFDERDMRISRRMNPVRNPNLPTFRATSGGTVTRLV